MNVCKYFFYIFVYLGSMFTRDGNIDADVERRVNAENKVNGGIRVLKTSSIAMVNSFGDITSPCLTPRRSWIGLVQKR